MHKNRLIIKIAGLLGATAVLLGAFGAHQLKEMMTPEISNTFQTAVSYQFYHALALLAVGILYKRYHKKGLLLAAQFMAGGVALFSGSLYYSVFLSLTGRGGLGMFAFVTPLGGAFLVVGWVCLVFGVPGAISMSDRDDD